MTIIITLDDEALDTVILDALIEHRGYVKQSIKKLKKIKDPKPFQVEDLANDRKLLDAFKVLCEYYGEGLK